MTQRPKRPAVRSGFWRHEDGSKELGVRIQCGIRHIHVEHHNVRALADALHDHMDALEEHAGPIT